MYLDPLDISVGQTSLSFVDRRVQRTENGTIRDGRRYEKQLVRPGRSVTMLPREETGKVDVRRVLTTEEAVA